VRKKKGKLIEAGGVSDHIHLYTSLPSTVSLAEMVNVIKSNSSRWIHEQVPHCLGFAWQAGYGAFSVSKSSESDVMRYIQRQKEHHRGATSNPNSSSCSIDMRLNMTNATSGIDQCRTFGARLID
jgi:REP element-mobilizing transposase RayT